MGKIIIFKASSFLTYIVNLIKLLDLILRMCNKVIEKKKYTYTYKKKNFGLSCFFHVIFRS